MSIFFASRFKWYRTKHIHRTIAFPKEKRGWDFGARHPEGPFDLQSHGWLALNYINSYMKTITGAFYTHSN